MAKVREAARKTNELKIPFMPSTTPKLKESDTLMWERKWERHRRWGWEERDRVRCNPGAAAES